MGRASSLSTKKRLRQSKTEQARNKANRTRLKTEVKKFRGMLESDEAAQAGKTLPATFAVIDKAVRKGVLHKNAAARHKSRLAKATNNSSK